MGSLKRIGIPIVKELVKSIAIVGMKRAMTATSAITGAWEGAIADGDISDDEWSQFGRVGRVAMGSMTEKITKDEAATMTKTILMRGLGLSAAEAELLILTAVKARSRGVDPNKEMGITPEDEEDAEDAAEVV